MNAALLLVVGVLVLAALWLTLSRCARDPRPIPTRLSAANSNLSVTA